MSYADGEEEIREESTYTYIRIPLSKNSSGSSENRRSKQYPWKIYIYVPQEYRIIFEKAKEIARREGRSLSDLIRELLRDYVRIHEPGNPQLPLTRFVEGAENPNACSVEGCDSPAVYQVFLDYGRVIEKLRVCEKHLRDLKAGWLGDRRIKYKSLSWKKI